MPKTKLPNVDLSADQLRQMRWWAQKNGKKLNVWVRDTLLANVPPNVDRLQDQERQGIAVQEEAFRQLEAQDQVMGLSLDPASVQALSPNPGEASNRSAVPVLPSEPPAPKKEEGPLYPPHPCRHLKREFTAHWDASKCQGTCGHPEPKQTGNICQWPGGVARNCPYFAPFNRPGWQKTTPASSVRR